MQTITCFADYHCLMLLFTVGRRSFTSSSPSITSTLTMISRNCELTTSARRRG